uniref:DUF4283 domain-containing protein n=1 Tax=Setaria italica TaxID=4555 RepID=A0A0Q3QPG3_SETIT
FSSSVPYTSTAKARCKVSATALIKIIEGNVPAELVKSELARAVPIKWDWVVQEHGKNTFIVPYLCQVELQRMIKWNNEIKPKQKLQKVWVHVYGIPYEIRSFLPLWAVGSILGATQKVHMRSMKKTGVIRLMVAVLDANCIPDGADIVEDDCLYEIFFKVDHVVADNSGEPDEFNEDDDVERENQNNQKDHEMEDAEKAHNNGSDASGLEAPPSNLQPDQAPKSGAPNAFEKQVVEQTLDLAVDIDELSAKVLAESDEDNVSLSAMMDSVHDLQPIHDKEQYIGGISPVAMQLEKTKMSETATKESGANSEKQVLGSVESAGGGTTASTHSMLHGYVQYKTAVSDMICAPTDDDGNRKPPAHNNDARHSLGGGAQLNQEDGAQEGSRRSAIQLTQDNSVTSSVASLKNIEIHRLKVSAKNNADNNKSSSPKINLDGEEEDLLDARLNHLCGND